MKRVPSSPSSWIDWSIWMTDDVGAAVERAGQGADAGGERGEEVGRARADHAHGRGRAVLLVVGVEQEKQVQRARDLGLGDVVLVRLREHHVQEVLAERQLLLREDVGQALLVAVDHRPDRADLRDRDRGRQVEVGEVLLEVVRRQVRVVGRAARRRSTRASPSAAHPSGSPRRSSASASRPPRSGAGACRIPSAWPALGRSP